MEKNQRFFDAAYAVALAAPGVGGKKHNNFRLGAIIVDKQKRVVSARFNSLKTHPKLIKYFQWPYCHAEAHAIVSLGLDNCINKSLYVVRIYRNNHLALAKPCNSCLALIKAVGIVKVFYSTHDGYKELQI